MLTTGNQLKAARALIGVEQTAIADAAGVHVNTIRSMEAAGSAAIAGRAQNVQAVQRALEDIGIEFLNHGSPGVRLREKAMTANTPRQRMTQKRRHHIFSENCTGHNVAPCCNCGRPIHRYDDSWIIEHKRALGLLGPDTNTNCGPSHVDCGIVKTHTQDLPRIAKAKRQTMAGAKTPSRGLSVPDGVIYDWKQRRYVRREVGER